MGLSFRPYQAGDEAAIVALHRRAFQSELELGYWRWKYLEAPEPPRITLAFDGEELVGHMAASSSPLRLAGKPAAGFQIDDVMLAARFENRTAGSRILLRLYRSFDFAGAIVHGFPVAQIRDFYRRLIGAVEIVPATTRSRLLDPALALRRWPRVAGALRGRLALGPSTPDPEVAPIQGFEDCEELLEALAARPLAARDKTREYLRWRYADPGYHCFALKERGAVQGLVILRLVDEAGWRVAVVADLLALHGGVARRLIRTAVAEARRRRAAVLRVWSFPGDPWGELWRAAGARLRPAGYQLTVVGAEIESLKALDWSFAIGDTDGI